MGKAPYPPIGMIQLLKLWAVAVMWQRARLAYHTKPFEFGERIMLDRGDGSALVVGFIRKVHVDGTYRIVEIVSAKSKMEPLTYNHVPGASLSREDYNMTPEWKDYAVRKCALVHGGHLEVTYRIQRMQKALRLRGKGGQKRIAVSGFAPCDPRQGAWKRERR
jgi:hypothetical protein